MGWGSSWGNSQVWKDSVDKAYDKEFGTSWNTNKDRSIIVENNTNEIVTITEKQLNEYKNQVPTHDPYTNPNALIYFECSCGSIHDPGTKSFASLTTSAGRAGWKIRFISGKDYDTAFCEKCGE